MRRQGWDAAPRLGRAFYRSGRAECMESRGPCEFRRTCCDLRKGARSVDDRISTQPPLPTPGLSSLLRSCVRPAPARGVAVGCAAPCGSTDNFPFGGGPSRILCEAGRPRGAQPPAPSRSVIRGVTPRAAAPPLWCDVLNGLRQPCSLHSCVASCWRWDNRPTPRRAPSTGPTRRGTLRLPRTTLPQAAPPGPAPGTDLGPVPGSLFPSPSDQAPAAEKPAVKEYRRAMPSPWDSPPIPGSEYQGYPIIGVPAGLHDVAL